MNFKFMLLSAVLVTSLSCYETKGLGQILSDGHFNVILEQKGQTAIAIGAYRNSKDAALFRQLDEVRASEYFPKVNFYGAYESNIPGSVRAWGLDNTMIAVFVNGNLEGRIVAPATKEILAIELKGILG